MTAITFDTLAFAKQLKKIGVPDKQAEAQTEMIAQMMTETIATNFATKQDLLSAMQEFRSEMSTLRMEFKQDIANLTLKIGAMIAGSITLNIGLLTLILKLASVI
ncbi:MAG: coiled-coil domain-containing protein [Gammaproteobacteria bacterium]|nr:coiled-coil domain-containing protein [Gammaproteobacteria bacterium]